MSTAQFIDMVAAGEANKAKEALSDMLGARAFEAIDARKVEIAQSLYATQEPEQELKIEVQDTEESFVEEEVEQYMKTESKIKSKKIDPKYIMSPDEIKRAIERQKIANREYQDFMAQNPKPKRSDNYEAPAWHSIKRYGKSGW